MPVFTIQTPDGRHVDIEAGDQETAMRGAKEWAASHQATARVPGVAEDVVKGGATGVGQGITSPLGLKGDVANAINMGVHGVAGLLPKGLGDVLRTGADVLHQMPGSVGGIMNPFHGVSSQDVNNKLGLNYEAQTLPGQVAQKVGQFLPNALVPESAPMRAASVIGPAVGAVGGRKAAQAMGAGPGGQAAGELVGSMVGGLGAGIRAPKIVPKPQAPKLEELQAARTAAYKAVDDMGVTYKPEAVQSLKDGVKDAMEAGMIDPDLHRGATALARKVANLPDDGVGLTKLDQVRKIVGNQIADKATTKEDRRLLHAIRANIDEFIGAAGPDQVSVASGDPARASAAIKRARDLHQRTSKIEAVQAAVTNATERAASTGSGGNVDNATRQELRKVLKYQRNLSPDEETQLRSAIFGDPGQNALRLAGKFSPSGNGLAAMLQSGAAVASHGATLPFMAGGIVAKASADAITKGKVAKLVDTMARGGTKALEAENTLSQLARRDPAAMAIYHKATKRLLATGGLAIAASAAQAPAAAQSPPRRR